MLGDETLDVLRLSVAMILLAAVLSLVTYTIAISTGEFTEFFNSTNDREESAASSAFAEFLGDGKDVPVATAYAVIAYNSDYVDSIHVSGYTGVNASTAFTEEQVLAMNLGGRCVLTAVRKGSGQYALTITKS